MTTYMHVSTAMLVAVVCVGAGATEPLKDEGAAVLVQDGREAEAWTKWGDLGDEFISVSTDDEVAMEGKHSLRVEVRLTPDNNWWPSLRLALPPELDTSKHNLLELHVYVPADGPALPDRLIQAVLYQADKTLSSAVLVKPERGTWNRLALGLGGLKSPAENPARVKLSWRTPSTEETVACLFYLDAVRAVVAADGHEEITELKDLCIETPLATQGKPQAAIVAPKDGRYAEAVQAVQAAIKRCGGCELPVLTDDAGEPQELLADRALIAVGNMNSSRFLETLYRHWYTFLDLRYPGKGGWVVRSLHNPYGTGHNVILLGGSDDEGVTEATRQFAAGLKPAETLSVGWLMKMKLGEGLEPPQIGETVYTWRDSWRADAEGRATGYDPGTYFAWNPISHQAALYYMTGEEKYLREFVRLALPDPDGVPREIRTCEAFYDIRHPLVENYHYRVHLVDCIWDLIEESPLLTDEVRLRITNELRAHQDFIDAEDDWCPSQGASRHGLYDALCIYTGSRYFAKYYPVPRWQKRLDNLKQFFSWWLEHLTWGELDTLGWVNTSSEPVLEYFLMADPEVFVDSGLARLMMGGLEILWTGKAQEESNRSQTISLMHKGAYLLKDGRYIYMARQAGYDFDLFRIGQSWWPGPDLKVEPPLDRVNTVSVMPLAQPLAERVQAPFNAEQGYQFLSYRTGVGPSDGYFFLDGYNGGGRNPHHVAALKLLRNTGKLLLSGYGNQAVILREGMVEGHVAKAARLDAAVALDGIAYVSSVVPDAAYSEWQRDILWVDDQYTLVADTIAAREPGAFEISCQWEPMGDAKLPAEVPGAAQRPNRTTVVCAQSAVLSHVGAQLRQRRNAELEEGQRCAIINAIYPDSVADQFQYRLLPVGENAAVVTGEDEALFTVGRFAVADFVEGGLAVDASAAHLRRDRICMMHGHRVSSTRVMLEATVPVSLVWDLEAGSVALECAEHGEMVLALAPDAQVTLNGTPVQLQGDDPAGLRLQAGRHLIEGATPREDVIMMLDEIIGGLTQTQAPPAAEPADEPPPAAWYSAFENDALGAAITDLAVAPPVEDVPRIWAATDQPALVLIRADGVATQTIELPAKLHALYVAGGPQGDQGVMAVAGADDDRLRAFSPSGDLLWEAESRISETYKVGDRYQAPWFTDPQRKHGILSLMIADVTGAGQPEIVLGRPSTVEYWGLDGKLTARLPINWGDCTELALLAHPDGPRVLVGKFFTGIDGISVLDAERRVIGNSAYLGVPAGSTRMSAWMQRGTVGLHAVDLDGDDMQEILVGRSGNWNDVRAYDLAGKCLWQRSFGPARSRSRFVRDLVVADVAGGESFEVGCGMANGWVCCFDATGAVLWTRKFPSPVTKLTAAAGQLVVGLESGQVALVNEAGDTVKAAELGSPVTALTSTEGRWIWMTDPLVLAGTEAGNLVALPLR